MPLRHLWPAARVWFWQAASKLGAAMAVAIICTLDDAKRLLGRYRCTAHWSLSETYPAQSRQAFVDERDCCGTFADRAAYTLHRSRAHVTNGVHARHAWLAVSSPEDMDASLPAASAQSCTRSSKN
jgi:hypothetical protein